MFFASYFFYANWNLKYTLLLLFSTVCTYVCGRMVDTAKNVRQKRVFLAVCFVINLSILFLFKYFNFAIDSLASLLAVIGVQINQPAFDLVLPVGISFYTFQALGYTIDVYRGEIKAEKNFLKYALFVSFFPQLVAGPIERSKNLLGQIHEEHKWDFERAKDGLLLMLWGYSVCG